MFRTRRRHHGRQDGERPGTQKNRDLAILGSGAWTGATRMGVEQKFILGMEACPGIKMLDLKTPLFPGGADRSCGSGRGEGRNSPRTSGAGLDAADADQSRRAHRLRDAGYQAGVRATVSAIVRSMVEGALHVRGRQNRQVFGPCAKPTLNCGNDCPAYRVSSPRRPKAAASNVFVPAERFVEYFQGVGLDPRAVASATIGAKNFQGSRRRRIDVVIPTADFAVHVATGGISTAWHESQTPPGRDLTQRELDALNASRRNAKPGCSRVRA